MKISEHAQPIIRFSILIIAIYSLGYSVTINESMAAGTNLPVGKTSRVVNKVSAFKNRSKRTLTQNDPVFSLERIKAGLKSHGEILLNDNTHILVGPGSEVSLDEFVISDRGIKSATINVLKGAFRFVSGNSRKGTFKIKTPLSTIGIRGTLFDVYVKDGGETDVILYSGRVSVCTLTNGCRLMWRKCDIIRVTSSRNIGFRQFLRSRNNRDENNDYSLVANQNRFQKDWRAPISTCSQRADLKDLDENGRDNDSSPSTPSFSGGTDTGKNDNNDDNDDNDGEGPE